MSSNDVVSVADFTDRVGLTDVPKWDVLSLMPSPRPAASGGTTIKSNTMPAVKLHKTQQTLVKP